jgi:Tol biopolymer transport system component
MFLVANVGRTVSREELIQAVWPDTFVEEGNLNYNMSQLRTILGEYAPGMPYIQTVPKRGYRFVVEITHVHGAAKPNSSASWGRRRRAPLWIAAALLLLLFATIVAFSVLRFRTAPAPEMRLDIATPPTSDPTSMAISPDGRRLIFSADVEGQPRLWIRPLDSDSARPLPGTDGGTFPFWSPDSRSIGFFADRRLKRLDVDRGTVQSLAYAETGRGGAWGPDGTILFQPAPGPAPLLRINANGGEPATVPQQGRYPQFLPDGRHFLYYAPPTLYASHASGLHGVYISRRDGTDTKWLLDADSPAWYAHGHLLFVRQGTLLAQAFDLSRLTLERQAFPVAQIAVRESLYTAPVATSGSGAILYRVGASGTQKQFNWFDRSGKEIAKIGEPLTTVSSPSISPDGRQVAFHHSENGNIDVWLLDLDRGVTRRFTSNPWSEFDPQWSPDGVRLVFGSMEKGPGDLYLKRLDGDGSEEVLFADSLEKRPTDWSADRSFILYNTRGSKTKHDIWALQLDKDRKRFPVVQTDGDDDYGKFSPDGRWIAYDSDESGRSEVYVQPFMRPGAKVRISNNGGAQVRWRPDGKELFYISLDGRLTAVPIRLPSNDQNPEVGAPVPLFLARVGDAMQPNSGPQYAISADGTRFLLDTVIDQPAATITVLLNWKPADARSN